VGRSSSLAGIGAAAGIGVLSRLSGPGRDAAGVTAGDREEAPGLDTSALNR